MSMSSMPSRPSHCWWSLKEDLKKAWRRKTVHLRCDEGCNCGGEYHALRGFRSLPRSVFYYYFNLLQKLDDALRREHDRVLRQLSLDQQRGQQQYESFLWDRRFASAGICSDCGKSKLQYPFHGIRECIGCGVITWKEMGR
jgi:hypothetical protein